MTDQVLPASPNHLRTPPRPGHDRTGVQPVATIYDVAHAAGVSIATVSRTLRETGRVAASTRQRVLATAAELRYVPSPGAASLRTGQTKTVAVLAPTFDHWFHAVTLHAVGRVLHLAGYDTLVLATSADQVDVLRKRVDGLLVVDDLPERSTVSALGAMGVPIVLVGNAMTGCSSVCIDDAAASAAATRHLMHLGHTRIAFIGTAPGNRGIRTSAERRHHGWLAALAEARLGMPGSMDEIATATVEGGRDAMLRLLRTSPATTAVVAASDEAAIGAVQMLRQSALRVPHDVSVTGIGDHDFSAAFGLTTVALPAHRLARIAAELLVSMIRGPGQPPQDVVLPTSLIERTTTGPARSPQHPTPFDNAERRV